MSKPKTTTDQKANRGRIQAQGGGVEKSESWAQDEPLSLEDGKALIEDLKSQLTKKELKIREAAFQKLEKYVEEHSEEGIPASTLMPPFKVKGSADERVDLEVIKGLAFLKNKD